MLPHCGFFYIPNDELNNVVISGCGIGKDWTVLHDSGNIVFVFDDGTQEQIPLEKYRSEVFRFADEIEDIYKQSKPKKLPKRKKDEFERNGQVAFWNEWHKRRQMR